MPAPSPLEWLRARPSPLAIGSLACCALGTWLRLDYALGQAAQDLDLHTVDGGARGQGDTDAPELLGQRPRQRRVPGNHPVDITAS